MNTSERVCSLFWYRNNSIEQSFEKSIRVFVIKQNGLLRVQTNMSVKSHDELYKYYSNNLRSHNGNFMVRVLTV